MVVHLPDVFWVFMLYVYTSQSVPHTYLFFEDTPSGLARLYGELPDRNTGIPEIPEFLTGNPEFRSIIFRSFR